MSSSELLTVDGSVNRDWVVVLRGGALGDFILSLPLLASWAGIRPVCLVSRRGYREVIPPNLIPERFVDIDSPAAAEFYAAEGEISAEFAELVIGADVVFFNFRDPAVERRLALLGARRTVWLNPRPENQGHAASYFLRHAGRPGVEFSIDSPLWPECPAGDGLWIHPGSGSPAKNAPLEHFARFAAEWQERHPGKQVHVSFGEADSSLLEPARRIFNAAGVDFASLANPSLRELREAMRHHARWYVGNDSGVSHLAGALGLRCHAFFISTNPEIWRPLGHCQVVIGTPPYILKPDCQNNSPEFQPTG